MTTDSISVSCLSDNETKVDLLNNEAIATTIVTLLLDHPDRPVTIGVHGDWGAGKSSVLEMIEAGLDGKEDVLCLKLNGWRFQGFEDAKIALLEGIVTGLLDKRSTLTKAAEKVKAVFRRIDWLKVAKKAGGLAFTAFTGVPAFQFASLLSNFEAMLRDPAQRPTQEQFAAVFDEAHSLMKPESQSKNIPEEIGEFRKAFDDLLKEARISRLVVLIDDLDRCLPDTAIETLEAVRLFVFTPRTAFVVAADEAMIEYAVRKHFPDLPDTTGPQSYARSYLEKLIQIPFRIPPLGITETRIYVALLLIGAELGDDDDGFRQLIAVAREQLKRPWTGKILDSLSVRACLNEKADQIQNALTLSEQIGQILSNGTKGNPRQIKRFLNTLVLRQRTAEARGFGDEVKTPLLAKLMLAERFLPGVFEQIAYSAVASPTGICEDLAILESSVMESGKSPGSSMSAAQMEPKGNEQDDIATGVAKRDISAQLTEWINSPATRAWASVQPPLAEVDLRPYLFITKDRKDYFGATSILGHLAAITEQLLGSKLAVQAKTEDLKQLAVPEATQVFELIRNRIVGSDIFDTQPPGADGLVVLVKAQPALQARLLDFLESMPDERLGPWVVNGWQSSLNDSEALSRFDHLLKRWASNTKNKPLKTAADGARRARKRD